MSGNVPPIEDSYWPAVKDILFANPSQLDNIKTECMICHATLAVTDTDDLDFCSGIHILACGHFAGHRCLLDYMNQLSHPTDCPKCRTPLKHTWCNHHSLGVPLNSVEQIRNILHSDCLGPEDGMLMPRCWRCELKWSVAHLSHSIWNRLTEDEKAVVGNNLMFHAVDAWGYQILYSSDPTMHYGEFSPDANRHLQPHAAQISWGYYDGSGIQATLPICTSRLLNDKCEHPRSLFRALHLRAWGPGYFRLHLALPYGGARSEGAFRVLLGAVESLPNAYQPLVSHVREIVPFDRSAPWW